MHTEGFVDKFLPTQPILSTYFKGDEAALIRAMYETTLHYSGAISPTEEFRIAYPIDFPPESNMSNVALLQFLRFLVSLKRPARILEIGTFLGISALCMATQLPPEGKVVTLEKFDVFASLARENIARNGFAERITVIQGDAHEAIQAGLPDPAYDLVFLDGNKEKYAEYFQMVDPLIPIGGLLVVDDIFFQGDALNPKPTTEKGWGTRAFMELARTRTDYFKTVLPVGDGVMLLAKLR